MNTRALRPSRLVRAALLLAAPVALSAQKPLNGFASKRNRAKKSSIRTRYLQTSFSVAHARDLVTGGLDDVGAGFNVGAMHGYDLFWRFF